MSAQLAVNAYPTTAQLSAIESSPLSYDLSDVNFRSYYTARTGYTFIGGKGIEDISAYRIEQDRLERLTPRTSIKDWWRNKRHMYQHIWNIWVSMGMPYYAPVTVQQMVDRAAKYGR